MLVGSGPLRRDLVARAAALGIERACLFIDPLIDKTAGVFDLIAAFDIFVLPSLSEGSPMALLEAGKAVTVVTPLIRTGGCSRVGVCGVSGEDITRADFRPGATTER